VLQRVLIVLLPALPLGVHNKHCEHTASAAAAAVARYLLLPQDNDVPLEALQTFEVMRPKDISKMTSQLLFPLTVKGDRQYYFNNIHESDIFEREVRGLHSRSKALQLC
jgi:hypothetical protein